ncbi:MAG TPA: DUF5916 domain-containing protein, partial [Vicinamibacterales bacterium]|nr:DUF5916 domain-containing protein [Vicinamibacterales bacterium]
MLASIAALLLAAAAALQAAPADAVAVPAKIVHTTGSVTEDVWRDALPIDAFVQREPEEGGRPSQRTEFRVAYDTATLFVQVHAFDTDAAHLVGYLTRRDDDSPSDWIRVLIDSYHDHRTAYEFAVNPAGVKQDRYWFNDTEKDDSWDAVWDVKVSRQTDGWTAEFRIPFSQIRFNPSDTLTFGFAVSRSIGRLNETSTWPLLARSATGYVSSFGELAGLSMRGSPKKLELVPYVVSSVTRQRPEDNPLVLPNAGEAAVGLDAKYALTPGLTLTTTFNPDFGQVEADPAVVNLTAFETFFNERRPFFVEGSGMFKFDSDCWNGPCSMFYTRRVGRAPQGTDVLPNGDGVYTEYPSQSTILGAAKLTGRVHGMSLGVMHAVTQEETATVLASGLRSQQAVEPTTNYTVARARREFANQSSIGGIFTSTIRSLPDALRFIPDRAFTGGIDVDARFKKLYSLTGYWAASTVQGDPEAISSIQENSLHYYQRPDATSFAFDPTRTSLNGTSARIGVNKIGGQWTRFQVNAGYKSPGFDLNDAGFLRRADERWLASWYQVRSDVPNRWFRNRNLNFNYYVSTNSDGDRLVNGGNINGNATFANNWQAGAGFNVNALTLDDRQTRGGPVVLTEGFNTVWSFVNTDNRKALSLNAFNGGGSNGVGSSFHDHEFTVTYRPITAITVSSGVRLNYANNGDQWTNLVTDTTDHYVFARLDQTTAALTERLNYTMSPTLSLQLYAEPFVSGGSYGGFKELVDGRNPDYASRYAPYAYDLAANGNPDFNVKSFRTTNVLRWEYKPGSTMFVVWQQSRDGSQDYGDVRFSRDFGRIFDT